MFNFIEYIKKQLFIYQLKKLGEKEYYKKYCGVTDLKAEDCKHEHKSIATIITNKGDLNSVYCKDCGAILSFEALLNNLNYEFAMAITKAHKKEQRALSNQSSLNLDIQDNDDSFADMN